MFSTSIIRSDDVSAHYFLDSPLKERHCVVKQVFKSYAQQMKGAAILEPISQRLPRHPGVTHYLIHLYDYPETAARGSKPRTATPRRAGRPTRSAHAVAYLYP
jgi:hypothetical protein